MGEMMLSFGAAGAALAGSAEHSLLGVLLLALCAHVRTLAWTLMEWLGATYITMRYITGPSCWVLFGWVFYHQPILRLPLLLYHAYIVSPAGRRAVGTNRWPWVLRWNPFNIAMASWFTGSSIVKTADLDPQRTYVFVGHPHGLLGNAWYLAFCTHTLGFCQLFPGIRLSVGVLDLNLWVSFCREICLLFGLCDVDRPTLLARLRQGPGSAVFLAVGGARESLNTQKGTMDLVLNVRKGFVRLALQAGADLVPTLAFGENDQYIRPHLHPGSFAHRTQTITKKICGFVQPWGYGRGILGLKYAFLPDRIPLTVVVGAPIRLPEYKGDPRSAEGRALVEHWHGVYVQALQELYDAHKDRCAPNRTRDMRIVE